MRNRDLPRIVKALRALPDTWAVKLHGSAWQEAGLFDVLLIRHGQATWIEGKSGSDKLSPAQERQRRLWAAAGAHHIIAGPGMTVDDVIREVLKLDRS